MKDQADKLHAIDLSASKIDSTLPKRQRFGGCCCDARWLGDPQVVALRATATDEVVDDICRQPLFADMVIIKHWLFPAQLALRSDSDKERGRPHRARPALGRKLEAVSDLLKPIVRWRLLRGRDGRECHEDGVVNVV